MNLLNSYFKNVPELQRKSDVVATLAMLDHLRQKNPKIAQHILDELRDQRKHLKMIASENYSSLSVQLAMGNWLTDKYAEGVPGHRFYAGCEQVDGVEELATTRLKELFRAEYAYVQPHSGADANLVAFWAIITKKIQSKELDRLGKKSVDELSDADFETLRQLMVQQPLLGMSLRSGGHLTHGYRHNVSSKFFRSHFYDVHPETHLLDYEQIRQKALEVRPLILLAGYSSYARRINFRKMREIADEVGAVLLVDMAHFSGLVAGGVFEGDENPIPFGHVITSTTHKTLRGPRGGFVLSTLEFKDVIDRGCPLVLGGPLPHVIAAKAVAFEEALTPEFKQYAHQVVVNSRKLAEELMKKGLRVITKGSDNHMVIVDVSPFGITGRQAEIALRQVGITLNRNAIPYDAQGAWYTSGIRIGTSALTTLGMKETEMAQIAGALARTIQHTKPATAPDGSVSKIHCSIEPAIENAVQYQVEELLTQFPLYPDVPTV